MPASQDKAVRTVGNLRVLSQVQEPRLTPKSLETFSLLIRLMEGVQRETMTVAKPQAALSHDESFTEK